MYFNAKVAGIILAGAFVSIAGNAALAEDTMSVIPQKAVSYGDLNLNTPQGAKVLYNRLRHTAYLVCGSPNRYDLSEIKLQACVTSALARAVAQVDEPALTNLYRAKTGQRGTKVFELARAP